MSRNLRLTLYVGLPIVLVVALVLYHALAGPSEALELEVADKGVATVYGSDPNSDLDDSERTEVETTAGDTFTVTDETGLIAVGGVYDCTARGFAWLTLFNLFPRRLEDCEEVEAPPGGPPPIPGTEPDPQTPEPGSQDLDLTVPDIPGSGGNPGE